MCKQAGRQHQHYLSKCPYLPIEDKQYISHSRQVLGTEPEELSSDYEVEATPEDSHSYRIKCSTTNRVSVKQSPHLKAFFDHHPLLLILDIGAETSMIKTSVAKEIGASIQKTTQKSLQADGVTQLKVVGEVHLTLSRSNLSLHLDALVVDNLDVDVLAGTPFMITNDISLRPAKQQVTVQGHEISYYGVSKSSECTSSIRRTHAVVFRAPSPSSVVWPGQYLELDLPDYVDPTLCSPSNHEEIALSQPLIGHPLILLKLLQEKSAYPMKPSSQSSCHPLPRRPSLHPICHGHARVRDRPRRANVSHPRRLSERWCRGETRR